MSEYIKKQKIIYKSIKYCFCPALQTIVYFNATGLSHLLYNRRRPRSKKEQHYRASIIKHLSYVVTNSHQVTKEIMSNEPLIIIWILSGECVENGSKEIIKVILRKEGSGNVYFLSAMKKKLAKKKPKP